MKKIFLVLTFLSVVIVTAFAQKPTRGKDFKIKGRVFDSLSGKPLEYATISIYGKGEKRPVNGAITDDKGNFLVNNLKAGTYRLVTESMGYKPFTLNNVQAGEGGPVIETKNILLVAKPATILQNVSISARTKLVENKIDRLVFNADKDLTSQSGDATDVLRKVPQVSVDIDGNVELAGSSSVRFLINGKPSAAFGSNIADVLQSIPANQIKSIEVITNPGAKYDAQGLGGIINIILKKNNSQGVNGNLSLTTGTRYENGSFNFNARKGKVGVNAYINGNTRIKSTTVSSSDRTTIDTFAQTNILLHQDGSEDFVRRGYRSGVNVDWDPDEHDGFSASFSYNHFIHSGNSITNQLQSVEDYTGNKLSDIATLTMADNAFHFHNVDAGIDYKRTFKKEDQELDVSANTSTAHPNSNNNNYQLTSPQNVLYYSTRAVNPGIEKESEVRIDYVQPFKKTIQLGTGGKLNFYDITSNSNVTKLDSATGQYAKDNFLSNSLDYHQKVYALYAELSFPVFKWFDAKIGERYERTEINTYYSNAQAQAATPGYNTFVPSIFFSKKLSENALLKFSYSKRIERPDYRDLNPYINTTDPKNLSTGNPVLKPELGKRYELGYSNDIKNFGSFMVSLFYRINEQDIQPFITFYPTYQVGDTVYTNVAVSKRENIGRENNMGLNFFGDLNFIPKLNIRTNFFFFRRHTINVIDKGYNYNSFNYRANMNASYQFSNTLLAELFGNFNSARHQAQGKYPSFTTYSLAIRKQFWNKKASLALTASNPFKKNVDQLMVVSGPDFTITSNRSIPFRSFGINFTWRFGKLEFKKDKDNINDSLNPPPIDSGN